jgi:hypothetical protein
MQAEELPAAEVYPGSNLASADYLVGKQPPREIGALARRHFTRIDFDRLAAAPMPAPRLRIA